MLNENEKRAIVCFRIQVVEMRVYDNGDTVYLLRPLDTETSETSGYYAEIAVRFKPNKPTPFRPGDIVNCHLDLADRVNSNDTAISTTRCFVGSKVEPYTSIYMDRS